MYRLPQYVTDARISDRVLRYEWDDARADEYRLQGSEEVADRLVRVTPRAKAAAAIGVFEWIIARFQVVSDDSVPFQVAEAMWCGNVHLDYLEYFELDRRLWTGPIRGPLWLATTLLSEMLFFREEEEEPEGRVAYLSNLALHVLPSSDAFISWRDACVGRLVSLYELPPDSDPFENLFGDQGGPLVPREAIDPGIDFTLESTDRLIDQLLRGVAPTQNPFLRAPDELLADGFEGAPYRIQA